MDIIIKDRCSGKTTSAIQEAYLRRLPLVCMDEAGVILERYLGAKISLATFNK